jgi:hypothetical protein
LRVSGVLPTFHAPVARTRARLAMPLTSRQDYLMRMIEQIIQVLTRVIALGRAGDFHEALAQLRTANELLLGPFSEVLPRLDSASAAQMLGNPDQLLAYARLISAEAEVRRMMGDAAAADGLAQRALELALEARGRGAADREAAAELIAGLASRVPGDRLGAHFQALLRNARE